MSQPNDTAKDAPLNRITLAERFWQIAPQDGYPHTAREPEQIVRHLLAILQTFRDLEVARDREATVATLSLLTLVRQQEMLGDLNYASPEQLRNEPLIESSLVFSVGVLLFERLCQRHPFSAEENPLRLVRMERAELGSGVNYFPFVPTPLRVVLQRALSSQPEDRPQTLAELAEDLTGFLQPKKRRQRGSGPLRLPRPPIATTALSVGEKIGLLLTTDETTKEMQMIAEPASPEEAPAPRGGRSSGWPLALAGAAAGMALIVAVTWSRMRGSGPADVAPAPVAVAPAPVAAAPAPADVAPAPVAAAPAPVAAAPAPVASAPVAAAPAPAPVAGPAELPAAPPMRGALVFDPAAGGETALAAVQDCFSPYERSRAGFTFGLSLLFSPETGRASKVYFPNQAELDPAHVNCLSHVLRRVSAGGRPDNFIAVEYRFVVKGDALRVSVVGTNP